MQERGRKGFLFAGILSLVLFASPVLTLQLSFLDTELPCSRQTFENVDQECPLIFNNECLNLGPLHVFSCSFEALTPAVGPLLLPSPESPETQRLVLRC